MLDPNPRISPSQSFRAVLFLLGLVACLLNPNVGFAQVSDWMTAGSYYTHDQTSGQRVHQYAPDPVVPHTPDPFMSVYRQQRSSISFQGSSDHYHKVYQFGQVVRPYGEWQRPFRPYSVPYSDWAYGSPFGHLSNPPRTNPMLPPMLYTPGFFPQPGFPPTGPFPPGPFPPGPFPPGPFPPGPVPPVPTPPIP
jgi:hypothetical protein